MNHYLHATQESLKRFEHIIYVSLKYTRTTDVLRSALQRVIEIYDILIEGYLKKALKEEKISKISKSPAHRATILEELEIEDQELKHFLNLYHHIRLILRSPQKSREEYRRHVTLIVEQEHSTIEVTIDNLLNIEKFLHKLYDYSAEKLNTA